MMAPLRRLNQLCVATSGNVATEFALIFPIILILLVGVFDLGTGFIKKIEVQSALNAGMQHAMQTQGADIATTRAVITHQLRDSAPYTSLSVHAQCRCNTQAIACSSSCSTGIRQFVTARADLPYSSPLMGVDMSVAANFELFVGYK